MPVVELPEHCLMVPGCRAPRFRYPAGGAEHAPGPPPPAERPCQLPLRCYCHSCRLDRAEPLGPADTPESIRLRLAALDERRRATLSLARPVT